jgi:translation initiation factor 1
MGNAKDKKGDQTVWQEFGIDARAIARPHQDLPPHQQDLRIQLSRKGRGGKTVSIISGLQHSPESLEGLCKRLKSQCGSGGTVKDNTLEIQGDHRVKLLQILQSLGYQAKLSGG